ncbi:MAG: coproporphyrinogen dehydrogenase HemZ [Coprococcus sp.]
MICLIQNVEDYNNDFRVMLQAFFPGVRIVIPEIFEKKPELKEEIRLVFKADIDNSHIDIRLYDCNGLTVDEHLMPQLDDLEYETASIAIDGDYSDKGTVRNPLKLAIYRLLSKRMGKVLPWGTLTGIRPTKIAMEAIINGCTDSKIIADYETIYSTSREKAALSVEVAHREKTIIDSVEEEEEYCLYIGIPFCPSRCLYCSFTSYPIGLYRDKTDAYLDALDKEMDYAAYAYRHKKLISIYIGGGTPSSIEAHQIDRLCTMIEKHFDMSAVREFTIEAGRPDSITFDKLCVMKKHNVSRISVNPQTMNDETLKIIGRAHTAKQTADVMAMARDAGFDNINMDLIVGLPGENVESCENTLKQIHILKPESLTVHSLAIKRAANLNIQMDDYRDKLGCDIDSQLSLVDRYARDMGLNPYYLYRQKNIAGNLENVGYSKAGLECLYNILIMEERTDIIGLGAGSSCKLIIRKGQQGVTEGTRIERIENCKSVDDYIARIDEMIERKKNAFAVSEVM